LDVFLATIPDSVAEARVAPTDSRPLVAFVRGPIVAQARSINNEATASLAFAYLSSYISKHGGYPFVIVDGIGEGLNQTWPLKDYPGFICHGLRFNEILGRIPAEAEVIAVSTMFSGEWPIVRDLITAIRERFPRSLIVAGGEHITALPEYSLRDCPALDACVRGEGEHTLLELLDARQRGEGFERIEGLSYLDKEGNYHANGGLTRIRALETIPWPHWPEGYLEKFWAAGKSFGVQSARDMPILGSRGCPYQCTFCSSPQMWTTRYILRDVQDLVAEIEHWIKRFDITSLQFYDLTAITKKRWTLEFCRELMRRGIKLRWSLPSGTRSEALDTETLTLLKQTGCDYLVYAPESGSPDTLERIQKRITLDDLTRSVLNATRLGIAVRTNLIIGFPHETRRHVFETIRYGLYLAIRGADEVSINIFSAYPGTEIFRELLRDGVVQLNDNYFLALTSLNSDYTSLRPQTVNRNIGRGELAFYRIAFMLMNYGLGYILYPSRIVRTLRYLFGSTVTNSATVLEHRLKDAFRRVHQDS
jgi:anaerobic magnesium-protoporphyrin IX monomethyl ester cyclase